MIRFIAVLTFTFLVFSTADAWVIALGRWLLSTRAVVNTVQLYRNWVQAGRPGWNYVKTVIPVGLGVVAVGDILERVRSLEVSGYPFQHGSLYRVYCYTYSVDSSSCYGTSGCGNIGVWGSNQCYGSVQYTCANGAGSFPVSWTRQVIRYRYESGVGLVRYDGPIPVGTSDVCPSGCNHQGVDVHGLCPSSIPNVISNGIGPFRKIYDDSGQEVQPSVDIAATEQRIREEVGEQVNKDKDVFVFPNPSSFTNFITRAFPNVSSVEVEQSLEGVRKDSDVPSSIPDVSDAVEVVIDDVTDTHTGAGASTDSGSGEQDISVPSGAIDPSVEVPERLPLPISLIQSIAQNHPLIRLVRGLSLSCGGSCSVPISVNSGIFRLNTSLDFCPFETLFGFIGSVLLAFVPIVWLFVRRD